LTLSIAVLYGLEMLVAGMFVAAVEQYPDRVFLRRIHGDRDERTSYRAAAIRIAATVERMRGMGFHAGDRLVIWLEDIETSAYLLLACIHLGVVPAPIGSSVSLDAAVRLAERVEARALFTSRDLVTQVEARGVRAQDADAIVRSPDHADPDTALATLRAAAAERSPDELYVLQPTSGTTGDFKLVMRQHRVFARVARIKSEGIDRDGEQARLLLVAALTHGMGQYVLATGVCLAAQFCLTTEIDTGSSLREVLMLDPTSISVTPRVLRSYHRQHVELGRDPEARVFGPSLRTLAVGGSQPDVALLHHATRHGIDVVEAYGASEISLLAMTRPGKWQPGIVGDILPDVELALDDDGELLARSPGCMVGYFDDEAQTREAFTPEGFYRTGDYCEITPARELRYLRRKRDVFNTSDGTNIYPTSIEEKIERIPWVAQAFLVGDQRPYLVAFLVVNGAQPLDDLHAKAREELSRINATVEPNQRVRRFALLGDALPTDVYQVVGHGKIRRERAAFALRYSQRIEELYGTNLSHGDPSTIND
jgi:long-subunit acyl-CoA synthetase (AMP-forming)